MLAQGPRCPARSQLGRQVPGLRVHTARPAAAAGAAVTHRSDCSPAAPVSDSSSQPRELVCSRRLVLGATICVPSCALIFPHHAAALPLAPLGDEKSLGEKQRGLTVEQVKEVLAADLGTRQYFVTGNLTQSVFADDCRFADPTNVTTGLPQYVRALGLLFDPEHSEVVLKSIAVTGPRTIAAVATLGGYLRKEYFFWQPYIQPVEVKVTYSLNEDMLVQIQEQEWSISGFTALRQTFTPTAGPS